MAPIERGNDNPGGEALLSIDTLKLVQRDLNLGSVHLAHVGNTGFVIAHTDEERADDDALTNCALHRWMLGQGAPPHAPDVYVVVPHEPDAHSEPYGADPWDFTPIDVFAKGPDHG